MQMKRTLSFGITFSWRDALCRVPRISRDTTERLPPIWHRFSRNILSRAGSGTPRHPFCPPETKRHSRIEVRAGDVAQRVDHRRNNESKRERDADVRDRAAAEVVDHDGRRAGEHEDECANGFGETFSERGHG